MWNHRVLEFTLAEDHYFTFTDNGNKKNYDNNQMEQLVLVAQGYSEVDGSFLLSSPASFTNQPS